MLPSLLKRIPNPATSFPSMRQTQQIPLAGKRTSRPPSSFLDEHPQGWVTCSEEGTSHQEFQTPSSMTSRATIPRRRVQAFLSGDWFMASEKGLLFDPTAGLFFDGKTNERTKLTTLGNEGPKHLYHSQLSPHSSSAGSRRDFAKGSKAPKFH